MQIESFTRQNLPDVRKAIQTSLDTVGKALRMEIEMGNITFNQSDFENQLGILLNNGKVIVIYIQVDDAAIFKAEATEVDEYVTQMMKQIYYLAIHS